jgi:hypothetical protein
MPKIFILLVIMCAILKSIAIDELQEPLEKMDVEFLITIYTTNDLIIKFYPSTNESELNKIKNLPKVYSSLTKLNLNEYERDMLLSSNNEYVTTFLN